MILKPLQPSICSVSRTFKKLQDRIIKHQIYPLLLFFLERILPTSQCKSSTQTNAQLFATDSAIGLHLSQNPACAQHYDDSRFSIFAKAGHLSTFLLLKPLLLLTLRSAAKKIRVQSQDYTLMTLSRWFFPVNQSSAFSNK